MVKHANFDQFFLEDLARSIFSLAKLSIQLGFFLGLQDILKKGNKYKQPGSSGLCV